MIRYKMTRYTVPEFGETLVNLLSIPGKKKIELRGVITDTNSNAQTDISVENNTIAEIVNGMDMGYGNFYPMTGEIEGPTTINATIKNSIPATQEGYVIIVYEE